MVRMSRKRLQRLSDAALESLCNTGRWKNKRADHKTVQSACSIALKRDLRVRK